MSMVWYRNPLDETVFNAPFEIGKTPIVSNGVPAQYLFPVRVWYFCSDKNCPSRHAYEKWSGMSPSEYLLATGRAVTCSCGADAIYSGELTFEETENEFAREQAATRIFRAEKNNQRSNDGKRKNVARI